MLPFARPGTWAEPGAPGDVRELRPLAIPRAAGKVHQRDAFAAGYKLPQVLARLLARPRLLPVLEVQQHEGVIGQCRGIERGRILNDAHHEAFVLFQQLPERWRGLAPDVSRVILAGDQQDANLIRRRREGKEGHSDFHPWSRLGGIQSPACGDSRPRVAAVKPS